MRFGLFIPSSRRVGASIWFDEGVITTTADANTGSIVGIGFPPWTGGAAQFITGYPGGKAAFVARAKELAERYGDRFNPPASLL